MTYTDKIIKLIEYAEAEMLREQRKETPSFVISIIQKRIDKLCNLLEKAMINDK